VHTRRLRARGAVESARGHYPLLVALHLLWPLALIAEVSWGGARPGRLAGGWLALFGAAQLLRAASIAALGERWTTRVLAVPGGPGGGPATGTGSSIRITSSVMSSWGSTLPRNSSSAASTPSAIARAVSPGGRACTTSHSRCSPNCSPSAFIASLMPSV